MLVDIFGVPEIYSLVLIEGIKHFPVMKKQPTLLPAIVNAHFIISIIIVILHMPGACI